MHQRLKIIHPFKICNCESRWELWIWSFDNNFQTKLTIMYPYSMFRNLTLVYIFIVQPLSFYPTHYSIFSKVLSNRFLKVYISKLPTPRDLIMPIFWAGSLRSKCDNLKNKQNHFIMFDHRRSLCSCGCLSPVAVCLLDRLWWVGLRWRCRDLCCGLRPSKSMKRKTILCIERY